jgi:hypothetical protein
MLLWRPVGLQELELIAESGWRAFPPRLFHQPIFYPVLTFDYARKIAQGWNTADPNSGFAGFVTRFLVDDRFASRYPIQLAGGRELQELWVPAEELDEFNAHLDGPITVAAAWYGEPFAGEVDPATGLPESVVRLGLPA